MEEEFIRNQERLKPQEEKNEEERSKVDDLRGTPMSVGNLEEIIDDNHAIVSTSVGSEHYVSILSFVDKDQLEPGKFEIQLTGSLRIVGSSWIDIFSNDDNISCLDESVMISSTNYPTENIKIPLFLYTFTVNDYLLIYFYYILPRRMFRFIESQSSRSRRCIER